MRGGAILEGAGERGLGESWLPTYPHKDKVTVLVREPCLPLWCIAYPAEIRASIPKEKNSPFTLIKMIGMNT